MLHAKFQDHRTSGSEVFFTIYVYGRGGHLGLVTWAIYINFLSHFPRRLHMNLALIGHGVLRRRALKILAIYMYIAPGQGQTPPLG